MKILIDCLSEFHGENVRLVKTLMKREAPDEYPELMKWSIQMLYFNGAEWIEICRIDNYLHEGRVGSHIHSYGKDIVEWISLDFNEAKELIKEKGARIIRDIFKEEVRFE